MPDLRVFGLGGATPGQKIRAALVDYLLLAVVLGLWGKFLLPGAETVTSILAVMVMASPPVLIVYAYLAWFPAVAKIRWALRHRGGTEGEYRSYRETVDEAAASRANTRFGRWAVGLRNGTW